MPENSVFEAKKCPNCGIQRHARRNPQSPTDVTYPLPHAHEHNPAPIPTPSPGGAGHGTPYMTLTTYAFVIPGDDARTARRAAGLFHASEGPFTAVEPKQHPDSTIAPTD